MAYTDLKMVGGYSFAARPPGKGLYHSEQQRAYAIVQALQVAADTCQERHRGLYQLILPALAAALDLKAATLHQEVQGTLDEAVESGGSSPAPWS